MADYRDRRLLSIMHFIGSKLKSMDNPIADAQEHGFITRRSLKRRVAVLQNKGVVFGRPYSNSRLASLSDLFSAHSEITVAELLGEQYGEWGGITLQPKVESPADADVAVIRKGVRFSIQVKTDVFPASKYSGRMRDTLKGWDADLPSERAGFVSKTYKGDALVSETSQLVEGAGKPIHAGILKFEYSDSEVRDMAAKVEGWLTEANGQLHPAPGIHIALFDIRIPYVDSEQCIKAVRSRMVGTTLAPALDAVAILTHDYSTGHFAKSFMARVWVKPGEENRVGLLFPRRPINLVKLTPITIPMQLSADQTSEIDKGWLKFEGVPFGRLL
jgi:hypothetical protein